MTIYVDISNYVAIRGHTGIQRVIREFLFRLRLNEHNYKYKIFYFSTKEKCFLEINNKEIISFLNDTKSYRFINKSIEISIDDMNPNDIYYDMDGVWNDGLKRHYLYKKLQKNGIKIYNFIYDLVPILLPQYAHENTIRNFTTWLYAIYQYSDFVFFDSRSAEEDFLSVQRKIGNSRSISTRVVKLGSDLKIKTVSKKKYSIPKFKYILFVGTIEPRKDQELVLDVFEKLINEYDINLVFIGKKGWNNESLIKRIKSHFLLNKNFFWLQNISDEELKVYYENAFIVTYISAYEGFGLPIAESLSYGNITIASKNSSMYEVGKNYADYISYNTVNELYDILNLYLSSSEIYIKKKKYIKENYLPYSWDMTYEAIADVFENITKLKAIETPKKIQFVFISIEIDNIKRAIKEIDKYMDFVDEYIIITRKDMQDNFKAIISKYSIIVVDENKILGEYAKDFSSRDHQSKNWLLRASLLKLDNLNKQFIMLDDDNIPLQNIPIEHFIKDGKYNAYYFYNLLDWNSFSSDYDLGQHNMKKLLDKDGFELLSYSSHKPQIIDKDIFGEVVEKYFDIGLDIPIDEWSIYFNYAISKYPFLFNKIKFDTLNWPANPSDWTNKYIPNKFNFENYYSDFYKNNINFSEKKLMFKKKQLEPYNKNKNLFEKNTELYSQHNMVHGVLTFIKANQSIYLSNMPYYLNAVKGTWLKISLNYKALNLKNVNVDLMYTINNKKGHCTKLSINDNYVDNVVDFAISCTHLTRGSYTLLINIYINNKAVYSGETSPYMVKLFVN